MCVCVSRLNKQLQTQRALRLQPAPVGPAAWRNRCLRSVLLPAPTATTPQPCPAALPTASSSWRAWLPPAAVAHALAAGVHLPCPPCTRLRYSGSGPVGGSDVEGVGALCVASIDERQAAVLREQRDGSDH